MDLTGGCEWVVEAHGCDADALRDPGALQSLFDRIILDMRLHPIGESTWHCFGGPGGVTGLILLAESHLACHTFPEYGTLCLNVFCCRPRPEWDFVSGLSEPFQPLTVHVRKLDRPYR